MGFCISVIKMPEFKFDRRYDSTKFVGDREFWAQTLGDGWESYPILDWTPGMFTDYDDLKRPTDFNKVREWIKENIKEGNRNLLFSGLDLLEFDKNLWFIGI